MAVNHRLDIVDGPRSGEKIPLKAGTAVVIGRTKQGVDLLDPRVSTRHAELSWSDDRLWVQDLNSATGTMVDGVAIGPEPVPLSDGHRLLIGDTVLKYVLQRRLLPQWVYWVALIVLVLSAPLFIIRVVEISTPWSQIHPTMRAPERVSGVDGQPLHPGGVGDLVPTDRCFLKETLPLGGGTNIHRVTDMNADQVSEIWVRGPSWERVYTFAADGEWRLLGELPPGCVFTNGAGMRPLSCDIRQYAFRPGIPFVAEEGRCAQGSNIGMYQLQEGRNELGGALDGVFVWMPNKEDTGPPNAPRPYAVGVRGLRNLAGWLYERGIQEDVHFIVCEEMLDGMGAQVLTGDGRIERIEPGCGYSLEVTGVGIDGETEGELPVAIAFTDTGRRLLGEQISVFLGGSELHHFQNPQQRQWVDLAKARPLHRTADYLVIPEPEVIRRTRLPAEDPDLELDPDQRLWGRVVPGKYRADTWVWRGDSAVLRTPCDAIVQVDTQAWMCPRPCLSGSTFMTIEVVEHGGSFVVPYDDLYGQVFRTPDGQVEVSVDVFTPVGLGVTQVVGASVAARDTQVCGQERDQGPGMRTEEGPMGGGSTGR